MLVFQLLQGSDNVQLTSRQMLPGISQVAKDRTFYIAPKGDNDQAAAAGAATS